jgi:hypothetical protein
MLGPPKGPLALRVSTIRQGVTGTNRSPEPEDAPAAAWVAVKDCPANETEPVRAAPELGATVKNTVPEL